MKNHASRAQHLAVFHQQNVMIAACTGFELGEEVEESPQPQLVVVGKSVFMNELPGCEWFDAYPWLKVN